MISYLPLRGSPILAVMDALDGWSLKPCKRLILAGMMSEQPGFA